MSDKKTEALKAKVKSLKGVISTNDQRIIAASSGVHFNTIRNYLYGFGSDERIIKNILSYASKQTPAKARPYYRGLISFRFGCFGRLVG